MDALDHIPDLSAALDPLLNRVQLLIAENQLVFRSHGRQGFHHRRSLHELDSHFARADLVRQTSRQTSSPLTVWVRP
jgi:hypothetical protein